MLVAITGFGHLLRKVQIRPWIKPGIAFLQSISRATRQENLAHPHGPTAESAPASRRVRARLPSSPRPPPVESAPGLPPAPPCLPPAPPCLPPAPPCLPPAPPCLPPAPPCLPPAPPGSSARFPTGPTRSLTGPARSLTGPTQSLTGPARPPGGDRIRPVPGRSRSGRNSAIWAGIPRNRLRRDPREPRLVWRRKYRGPNSMDCFLPIQTRPRMICSETAAFRGPYRPAARPGPRCS
jgi:hypothetical protein